MTPAIAHRSPLVGASAALALALTLGCGQSKPEQAPETPPAPAPEQSPPTLSLLQVGAPAPQFTAEAHDGTTVSMKQLAGQPVVVYFYPKDATPG